MNTIQCDIVSAHEMIFSGNATMVIATGTAGELGITPRHAPLMTTLKSGPIRVLMPDGEENIFFAGGGVMEVMPNLVTVLADTALRADDLDEVAAARARQDAERELQEYTDKLEIAAAQAKLAKALAQLQALERMRKKTRIKR